MEEDTEARRVVREACPKCGESFNHEVDNGFRNWWPTGVNFEVCTTDSSERMFVHTDNLRIEQYQDPDNE